MITFSRAEWVSRILLIVVAVFFAIAAAFALTIALTLIAPGTPLDAVWAMKPSSRAGFVSLGVGAILLMLLLTAVLIVASIALFRGRRWARWVGFALLGVNVVPDAAQSLGSPLILLPLALVALVAVWLALPVTGRACRKMEANRLRRKEQQ